MERPSERRRGQKWGLMNPQYFQTKYLETVESHGLSSTIQDTQTANVVTSRELMGFWSTIEPIGDLSSYRDLRFVRGVQILMVSSSRCSRSDAPRKLRSFGLEAAIIRDLPFESHIGWRTETPNLIPPDIWCLPSAFFEAVRFPFDCFVEYQRGEFLTDEGRMMALVLDDACDWQTERGRTPTCAAARTESIRSGRGPIFYTTSRSNVRGCFSGSARNPLRE
jgi:hypothetical protein